MSQSVQLMENITEDSGNWLDLVLVPPSAAVGARVYAEVGGVWKRRDILPGRSYLSGAPSEVHFGLGEETVVPTVQIEWPDGGSQVLTDVAAGQLLTVAKHPDVWLMVPTAPRPRQMRGPRPLQQSDRRGFEPDR